MSRSAAAVLGALCALCASASMAPAAPAAEKQLLLPAPIPPELQALEAKADALQITSQRISVSTELRLGKEAPKGLGQFLKLFDTKIEGVETIEPPAAALKTTLFGSHLRLRYVDGHVYLFSWGLGLHDGGRPWIELGHGLLGRVLAGSRRSKTAPSTSGAEHYSKLFTLVNNGVEIHQLAPSVLYGQAVTGFQEKLDTKTLAESGESVGGAAGGSLRGGFSAARRPSPPPKPAPAPAKAVTLSTYFAASGAVVREQVETGDASGGSTVIVDVPAIDFPYTIAPPPPSHVITEKQLLRRFPPHRESRSVTIGGALKK
jgi:hypothetical protein